MPDGAFTIEDAVVSPEHSQDAIALDFSLAQDGNLIFVPVWGHWLRWDGRRWARDDTMQVSIWCEHTVGLQPLHSRTTRNP
jgi:D5-like protein